MNLRGGHSGEVAEPPTAETVKQYWGDLFGKKSTHNVDAEWLKEEEATMANIPVGELQDIIVEDLQSAVRNVSNWKAPGLDQIQKF